MFGKIETILRYRPAGSTQATVRYKAVPQISATAALKRLKEGNTRFVRGHARFPTVQKEILANQKKIQANQAAILANQKKILAK